MDSFFAKLVSWFYLQEKFGPSEIHRKFTTKAKRKQRGGYLRRKRRDSVGVVLFVIGIIVQHAVFRTLDIVKLPAFHRPDEKKPAGNTRANHEENQKKSAPHSDYPRARREFPTTLRELRTMASAATMG